MEITKKIVLYTFIYDKVGYENDVVLLEQIIIIVNDKNINIIHFYRKSILTKLHEFFIV